MSIEADLLGAFEEHLPDSIQEALSAGASPTELLKGKRPVDCLIEGYLRSSRFDECLQVLLDAGASIGDPLLQAVLMDDDEKLRRRLKESNGDIQRKMSPLCAFTSCRAVSALHLCAEFNSLRCASVLLDAGADVNARADVDGNGLGGQTPIFHAVNSIFNYCRPVMELLAERGAGLDIRVKSLLWGESFDWETVIFDVTPISYAQCGLYKQFHRAEGDVYSNIAYLHETRYGAAPALRNVPNKYLRE